MSAIVPLKWSQKDIPGVSDHLLFVTIFIPVRDHYIPDIYIYTHTTWIYCICI